MAEKDIYNSIKESPRVMGILNATPDSFSDGGKYLSVPRAMDRIYLMIKEGAEIIDIGGESTRPGADGISAEEELNRVMPILEAAIPAFRETNFSIDTTKYEVARKALEAGATIVNDISGLQKEDRLADLCAEFNSTLVIMHSQGDPKTMQVDPHYDNVVDDICLFFEKQIELAQSRGAEKIILDPGLGFGKTLEQNLKLVADLDVFKKFGFPVMVGASRKSMIGKILGDRPVNERLFGSVAVHYHCLVKGADIIRVHDVEAASDSIRVFNAVQKQS